MTPHEYDSDPIEKARVNVFHKHIKKLYREIESFENDCQKAKIMNGLLVIRCTVLTGLFMMVIFQSV